MTHLRKLLGLAVAGMAVAAFAAPAAQALTVGTFEMNGSVTFQQGTTSHFVQCQTTSTGVFEKEGDEYYYSFNRDHNYVPSAPGEKFPSSAPCKIDFVGYGSCSLSSVDNGESGQMSGIGGPEPVSVFSNNATLKSDACDNYVLNPNQISVAIVGTQLGGQWDPESGCVVWDPKAGARLDRPGLWEADWPVEGEECITITSEEEV